METKSMKVKVTYTEEILGTANANPEIHREFIASKGPDAKSIEEEVEAIGVEEYVDQHMTVFPRLEDGTPFLYDYQWKGYFKDCCGMLRRCDGTESKKLKAYLKEIDGLVYVSPRRIPFIMEEGAVIGDCQRPLRAKTMQGDRVAIAHSETVPAGSSQEFTVTVLREELMPLVREWLDYGILHGHGQWRNSGKGRFTWEIIE